MNAGAVIKAVWREFAQTLDIKKYKLFLSGSRAAGTAHPHSDFDFIVQGDTPIDSSTWLQLKQGIDQIPTLFSIDIVDFTKAMPDFQAIAKKTMKEVHDGRI